MSKEIQLLRNKNYRKDIDGLRAISVLLVIFYHLRLPFASAGFIGVDVFFVISGYLITRHILSEHEQGKFTLRNFYLRRMRRILPALLCMMFFVTIAVFFLFLPDDIKQYLSSELATLLSVSNIYFYRVLGLGYFSVDAKILPLLHTWTLGVEEQFYIVWPLVIAGLLIKIPKKIIFYIILGLLICSFLMYYGFHSNHKIAVFYLPITRAFELLAGCLLAISWKNLRWSKAKSISGFISLLGLGLIIYAGCFLTATSFPGIAILLPCVGAIFLIYGGEKENFIGSLLSIKPFVFIGLISYSLYLWHWPIISFFNYFNIPLNFRVVTFILLVSFLISILSWYYVERVFRYKKIYNIKKTIICFLMIPIISVSFLVLVIRLYPYAGYNKIPSYYYGITKKYVKNKAYKYCIDAGASKPLYPPNCLIGKLNKSNIDAFIVGDSHAMSAVGMLSVLLKNAGLNGFVMTQSGSPFVLGDRLDFREDHPMVRARLIANKIKQYHYKYVVMGGYWNMYSDQTMLERSSDKYSNLFYVLKKSLNKAVKVILSSGARPAFVLDVPPLINISMYCGFTRLSKYNRCYNLKNNIYKIQGKTRKILFDLKKKYPKIILIDPNKVICPGKLCYSSLKNIPLYNTGGHNSHLNYVGSKLIGKLYLNAYENPFKP